MFINYKRHRILTILNDLFNSESADRYSFDFLCKKLNVDYPEMILIKSELIKNEEVVRCGLLADQLKRDKITQLTKNNSFGLYITDNGLTALSNKKYLNIIYTKWIDTFKNIVQILIPILMASIAILALYFSKEDNKAQSKEIKELRDKILILEESEPKTDTLYLYQNSAKDSLNTP